MVRKITKKVKSSATSKHKKTKTNHFGEDNINHTNRFKEDLLRVDKDQDKYDKLFEQKLSEQYKEFRNIKEHSTQSKRFFQVIAVIIVIVLVAFLLVSFG